ncbi:MAG: YIP1 family protein [Gammaproteobacteria bacterium]|nr:YIP1 family protein [Gammaproteobacteria bacterium]NND38466.1 YIP1 family protein [Pseudomonadales bacterium]MBT8150225.1 YIP1 family protein [Gammaproteobacteria bacterium]NNL11682.1 YIP1 family protein [Pseudomonadales bacterium]NNM11576.1 YIP1 family protein [Pseudomonadales bacterium]
MLNNPASFLFNARAQWQRVATLTDAQFLSKLLYPVVLGLGTPIAWYYGTTRIGWTVGGGEVVRLTEASALQLVSALYVSMLVSLCVIGYFIHWMAETYGSVSPISKGVAVAGYTATPLFIAGLCGFYPIFWFDMLVGITALCWSVYMLYVAIPVVMGIPEERGFLFASAVVAICMVIFICMMGATVILWDMGVKPVFTD